MKKTKAMARLARSIALLRSFRFEQTDPDVFYSGLARDTAAQVDAMAADAGLALAGARVLDVGGGPGYFAKAFARRGANYVAVEPDVGEMAAAGIIVPHSVRGDGTRLPFATNTFDIAYSSNVAEHIPNPWDMGEEMLRVVRPGGLVIISYTVWLGPFGGHETGLWEHYVGGAFARDRYTRRHGHEPKNVFGTSLFALSCQAGLSWARAQAHPAGAGGSKAGAAGRKALAAGRKGGRHELIGAFPRYHPAWAWWVVKVPILREFVTSNLVIVLRKATPGEAG